MRVSASIADCLKIIELYESAKASQADSWKHIGHHVDKKLIHCVCKLYTLLYAGLFT